MARTPVRRGKSIGIKESANASTGRSPMFNPPPGRNERTSKKDPATHRFGDVTYPDKTKRHNP